LKYIGNSFFMKIIYITIYILMLQGYEKITEAPIHTYYEIEMVNVSQTSQSLYNPEIKFTKSRNSLIIANPSLYFCSVVKFSIDTPTLPVFIPDIKIGQVDVNLTTYEVTIYDNTTPATAHTQNLEYINSSDYIKPPRPPIIFQDIESEYYHIYNMKTFVRMLNTAIIACTTALSIATAPFFDYDNDTSIFSLYVPTNFIPTYKLVFNQSLRTLLAGFEYETRLITNTSLGVHGYVTQFVIENNNNLNSVTVNSNTYYKFTQEYSTLSTFNPIKKIVFMTSMLPIRPALTQPPEQYNTNIYISGNGNNSNLSMVITDFEVGVSAQNRYMPNIVYTPQAEYRLIDMTTDIPINEINVSVYWKDKFGTIHPIKLAPNCSCALKLLFRRRDFNLVSL
jgi:hypothetical protein